MNYVHDTLDLLMASKRRLAVTPIDYSQACAWERQGIPYSIVERVIQEKVQRSSHKGWLPVLRLDWLDAEVQDAYTQWRKSVGPWAIGTSQAVAVVSSQS